MDKKKQTKQEGQDYLTHTYIYILRITILYYKVCPRMKRKKNRHAHKTNQPNNMTARASPMCVSMPHIWVCVCVIVLWVVCVCFFVVVVCCLFVFSWGESIYLVYLDGTIIKKYIGVYKLLVDNSCCGCGCGTTYMGKRRHSQSPHSFTQHTHIKKIYKLFGGGGGLHYTPRSLLLLLQLLYNDHSLFIFFYFI